MMERLVVGGEYYQLTFPTQVQLSLVFLVVFIDIGSDYEGQPGRPVCLAAYGQVSGCRCTISVIPGS